MIRPPTALLFLCGLHGYRLHLALNRLSLFLLNFSQVSGAEGIPILTKKIAANGPGVLFEGALATATATFVGHYPW